MRRLLKSRVHVGISMFVVLLVASLVIAACGGGGSDSSRSSADQVIEIRVEQFTYSPERIEVKAGETVTLRLRNLDAVEHDIEVQGMTAEIVSGGGHGAGHAATASRAVVVHAQAGEVAEVTFVADEPGTYEFICTEPGHKEHGMVGELVVS